MFLRWPADLGEDLFHPDGLVGRDLIDSARDQLAERVGGVRMIGVERPRIDRAAVTVEGGDDVAAKAAGRAE